MCSRVNHYEIFSSEFNSGPFFCDMRYAEHENRKNKIIKKCIGVDMTSKRIFGAKTMYFWTNFIIGVFGPKTKLYYISNLLLYTKYK